MSQKKKSTTFSTIKVEKEAKHPLQKTAIVTRKEIKDSKQIKEKSNNPDNIINPQIGFDLLRRTIQTSSLLSGIIKKIASSCDTGFLDTRDKDLNKLLSRVDVNESIFNLCIFGNLFYEPLKNNAEKIIDLDIILTETCKIADKGDDGIELIQQGEGNDKATWEKGEFIHIKRSSITSKYYGDTVFTDCIESILLLYFIEQVYRKLFENGMIEPQILIDEENVMTPEEKDKITAFIKDYFRGVDNGFELGIISGKIKKLELSNKIDHNSFIALKKEIKEDIAIALQIPFDLLSGKNSNRATRDSSFEDFNLTTIKPTQARFIRQLREGLRDNFGDVVDEIELNPVDTKNQEEESKVVDRLIRSGVLSVDEGREYIGYEATGIAENMTHKVYGSGSSEKTDGEKETEEQLEKIYKKIGKK